ncbi:MAG: molybdopterin-dependent oxidoreductase [Caldilineaceae bacterium]|nr:molybdopterin-dependent oxidoreductase [Caldilineaceae bacterium]
MDIKEHQHDETGFSRRSFLKWSAAAGATTALLSAADFAWTSTHTQSYAQSADAGGKIVRTCCPAHNCGGRCPIVATVEDGVVVRLESDDRTYDEVDDPRILACSRGKSYRRRLYHPDRLKTPMKRVGERGEGKFEPISWEEAIDLAAGEIKRVKETYGPSALFVPYGTGSYQQVNGSHIGQRLLNLYGGRLDYYNNYSWAQIQRATPTVYGTQVTGNQRQDWLNAKYIIMWSWNPAEMIDGSNSAWFVKKAKENGAKVVVIDPRKSLSAVSLADEWIPIRPGTDSALMSAMAYVMITEELYDKEFVETHCVGFDETQMPKGYEQEESYKDYILGTRDGTPKTPAWAEAITQIPRAKIIQLAREYATIKPGVLYQGYGMQRRAYGEQPVRGGCVLAAITGNVGIPGGWASGIAFQPTAGPFWTAMPLGDNPVKTSIPCFLWSEAALRGTEMTAADGVLGADKLDNNIKLLYAVATNCLVNQHGNINRSAEILKDASKVEFIIVQDQFLTSTGKFADLLLPACMGYETYGLQDGWKYGEEVIFMPKVVEPAFESKSDYRICAEIAEKLGIGDAFTEGRDERGWIEWIIENSYRPGWFPDIPTIDEFEQQNINVYSVPVAKPAVAFADFRADPKANPLPTPSGLIEIFSPELFDMNQPDEIPAVPKYIQEWESPFGPEAEKYPLSAMGHHYMHRVHSTHDNVDWLEEAFPQRVFINPIDAAARGIADGDPVRIYNDRGTIVMPCRLTQKIIPGVVDIPTGGWWTPDENGIDRRGAVNVLSSERWSPLAFGNAQHTIMVQIEREQA